MDDTQGTGGSQQTPPPPSEASSPGWGAQASQRSAGSPVLAPSNTQPGQQHRHDLGGSTRPRISSQRQNEGGETPNSDEARTYVWGTEICVEDVHNQFRNFFRGHADDENGNVTYVQRVERACQKEKPTLELNCKHVLQFSSQLYSFLVNYPDEILPIIDVEANSLRPDESIKPVQVQPFNLHRGSALRELSPTDINKMVRVKGLVTRVSGIEPDLEAALFRCQSCHSEPEPIYADGGRITEPRRCPLCNSLGALELVHNRCSYHSRQIVKLQEAPEEVHEGETPHTLTLCAYDALVDSVKPGDRVEATGRFCAQSVRLSNKQRTLKSLYRTYIDAMHFDLAANAAHTAEEGLDISDERKAEIRQAAEDDGVYENIVASLAPSIWEMDDVKKGVLCQLMGGVSKTLGDSGAGKSFRGDLNVLLVGDPGVSKSQLLSHVNKIAPRGMYTSGRGSSAVGLTAYVAKDPESRQLVLESGALVLSDEGVCCIDEFDKMSDSARACLHEVMEQQTVSVAKAGIIATLNARTSVLASANPLESRYNPRMSVVDNINLPPTLLSRFDLIYLLLDKPDETRDRRLAKHLCRLHSKGSADGTVGAASPFSQQFVSDYITYARSNIFPRLSEEASQRLVDGYVGMRRVGGGRKVVTATPRQLESLVRLSEALARIHLRQAVWAEDVDEAMRLVKVALQHAAVDPQTGLADLDKIITGTSAQDRQEQEQLKDAIRDLLDQSADSSGGMSIGNAVRLLKENSGSDVRPGEVRRAFASLAAEEEGIKLTGDRLVSSAG